MTDATSFIAAMVQMRTGQTAPGNIEAASALIRDAAKRGAKYVQTPEMTTLLVRDRDRLMTAVTAEDDED